MNVARWVFNRIANNEDPTTWASRMRRQRFEKFRAWLVRQGHGLRVLDVGGTEVYWRQRGDIPVQIASITLLNLEGRGAGAPGPGFSPVAGDARNMTAFADKSFDVVFSNSMIEHAGTNGDQRRVAEEIRRVGRTYYVQTPNRDFPIEPHFLFPFFQFLPIELQAQMIHRTRLGWYQRIPDIEAARAHVASHRLLRRSELQDLFPEATIISEKVLGLTKSLTAVGPDIAG